MIMAKVAVLITCFNRVSKTLNCIKQLYNQKDVDTNYFDIYIVDGGSKDNTPQRVLQSFPKVHIEVVEGLYWAGGMRKAWENALSNGSYDFLWLVNDDTFMYPNCFRILLDAHSYCVHKYGKGGIYTGCTRDPQTGLLTYGAKRLRTPDKIEGDLIAPNGKYQECDLCNGNSLLISKDVFLEIGGLSKLFTHGIADWEYSLRAKRHGFPVLLAPDYLGECERDHGKQWLSMKHSLKERLAYMNSPKGLCYHEFLFFLKSYFPKDYYPMMAKMWIKTLFPFVYDILKKDS